MSLEKDIQDLVLDFFTATNSVISEEDGLYRVSISDKYQIFFQASEILFAFDRDTSAKYDCELIIVGSKTLSLIIENCSKKGPILLRKSKTDSGGLAIRYHFFIVFSGMSGMTMMAHKDVDLATFRPLTVDGPLDTVSFSLDGKLDSNKITSSYATALDEIQKEHDQTRSAFMDDANKQFLVDFESFVSKYDSLMRGLDSSINKKDVGSSNPEKTQEFRFKTVDKINNMEKEKSQLMEILQKKHRILLEYRLVACEIIAF